MFKRPRNNRPGNPTREIVYAALIAGVLFAGKTVLRALPNIEIVTVSILVFAYVFPVRVVFPAVLAFCTLEWLTWGFGYWVVYYYIYYPLLALAASALKRVEKPALRTVWAAIAAAAGSAVFCLLSAAIDAAFLSGLGSEFLLYFAVTFYRGIYFFIALIVSNAVIVPLLFPLLCAALQKAGAKLD